MPIPDFVVSLREKIGHDPLWLPGVTAVVTDDDGRLLLVRRADDGRWTPVTGIVDPGEEPAVAARREVAEEAGVEVVVERLASTAVTGPVVYDNGDRATYLDLTFACRYVSGTAHVADDESSDVGWYARDDLPAMDDEFLRRIASALDEGPEASFVR